MDLDALALGLVVMATPGAPAGNGCTLDDNGDADGVNGYPNGTHAVFGARRTLLDDFRVPNGQQWCVEALRHLHVWETLEPGAGTGMDVTLWSDLDGAPAEPLLALTVTEYRETATGRTFFERPEAVSWASFEPVFLEPASYWLEATVVGPEPDFWLTASVRNSPCWVSYEDLGGLQPGRAVFGMDADLAWCLAGAVTFIEPFYAFGLPHRVEGGADIVADEGGFVISDIGPSGADGVSFLGGEAAEGWLVAGELVGGDLPSGARVVVRAQGTIDGVRDRDVGAVIIASDGSDLTIRPDLGGLEAVTYTLRLTNDGVLVFSRDNIPQDAEFVSVPAGQTTRLTAACRLLPPRPGLSWSLASSAPIQVNVPGESFMADGLEIVPDGTTVGLASITQATLLLADTPDVRVDDEALHVFRLDHRALGDVRMDADADGLLVSGLGADGDDGVRSDLPPSSGLDVATAPIPIGEPNRGLVARATGTFGGARETVLGVAGFRNLGGLPGVFADFAGVSRANIVRLEVYDDAELVGSTLEDGSTFRIALLLAGPEGEPRIVGSGFTSDEALPGYGLRLDPRGEVRPNAGGTFVGDEIRLLVEEPDGVVEHLSSFELTGARLSTLVITDVAVRPVACPGDLDGSGVVDVADLLAILARWGQPGGPEDLDGSGVVDVGDLLVVLATWGPCP